MKDERSKALLGKIIYRADEMIGKNQKLFSIDAARRSIRSRTMHRDPFFWHNGILSMAISEYQDVDQQSTCTNNSKLLSKKYTIKFVDDALFYYANFEKLSRDDLDLIARYLREFERDPAGSILYRNYSPSAYIDTLGMICPFLFRYAKATGNHELARLAMSQFELFFENGFDAASGLPYHGYNVNKGQKDGIIGWGRGLGWMMLGLADSLAWVESDTSEYKKLNDMFGMISKKVLPHQRADGGYSWQLQAQDGPLDISATSMIGYSLARYSAIARTEENEEALRRTEAYVLSAIDARGYVTNSSAECRGFSMYPQRYEINSWGQGFAALFLIHRYRSREV